MFTDEMQFNRAGVNNTHNSHVWGDEDPHATVESNFQQRFSVNVWCAFLDDQLIGPFILEGRLRRDVPQISTGGIAPTFGGCAFG